MGHAAAMALDAAVDVSSNSKPPVPPPSPPRIDSWARGGRRSKRRAGSPAASDGGSAGGRADVVHDQSEQEYLALCLLMLSRGLRGDGATAEGAGGAARAAANKAGQHQEHGYGCSVCGKVFSSYQALGGHKTSHRKPLTPPTPPPAALAAPGAEALSGSGGTAHAEEKEKEKEKVHQCSLCLRTFPSGQALGGHKRLHYEGGAGDGAKDNKDAVTKANKASAAAAATTAVLRDFDLNLPAEGAPPEAKRARTTMLLVV